MTKHYKHNQKCYACGLPKGATFLGYDIPTMKTFCLKNCKKASDIPDRELVPVTNEDLQTAIVQNFSETVEQTFAMLLGKVASVRLHPAHIMHVLKVAEFEGFDKIQHTLVNIIENDMKERNLDHVEMSESNFTHKIMETHKEMEEQAPEASPKVQEIFNKIGEEIKAADDEKELEEIKEIEEENGEKEPKEDDEWEI